MLKSFLPLLLICIFVSVVPVIFSSSLHRLHIDQTVVITGNLILFFVAAVSLVFYRKALLAGNTQVFLRNFYMGMMIKFFICIMAAVVYIYSAGQSVNRAGLFCVMALYLVYTFAEIALLMKQSNQIKLNRNA